MSSLILQTTTKLFLPIFLLFSLFLLLRGHNSPGGGFVGGLMAASAVSLYALAFGVAAARRLLPIDPRALTGVGLAVAAGSGMLGPLAGEPYMAGTWIHFRFLSGREIHLGTPILFDFGVYLLVLGVVAIIVLRLSEEE